MAFDDGSAHQRQYLEQRRREYKEYLASPLWKLKRKRLLRQRGWRCQRCQKDFESYQLEIHHLTYERFGKEKDTDLLILCKRCHVIADEERIEAVEAHREEVRFEAWAARRYGVRWEQRDPLRLQEEFARFLEMAEEPF